MKFLKRVLVISIALFIAGLVMSNMSGFEITKNGWVQYAVMAVILAILNAVLLPILKTLSCGAIILTLGFFSLILNAFVFWLASVISTNLLGGGITITKFWPAFVGSLIVSLATSIFVRDDNKSTSGNDG